jgi:hypothetical protein
MEHQCPCPALRRTATSSWFQNRSRTAKAYTTHFPVAAFLDCSDNVGMAGKLDRAITEAEREIRSQEVAAEVYVRERRALDEQIPAAWTKFKTAIQSKCEVRPKHLRFLVSQQTEVKVERLNGSERRVLEMRLLREPGIIEFCCGEASGCCTIRRDRQNIARICDQDGNTFSSSEDAADEVLSLPFRDRDAFPLAKLGNSSATKPSSNAPLGCYPGSQSKSLLSGRK